MMVLNRSNSGDFLHLIPIATNDHKTIHILPQQTTSAVTATTITTTQPPPSSSPPPLPVRTAQLFTL